MCVCTFLCGLKGGTLREEIFWTTSAIYWWIFPTISWFYLLLHKLIIEWGRRCVLVNVACIWKEKWGKKHKVWGLSAWVFLTKCCLPWWKALFIFLSRTALLSYREGICRRPSAAPHGLCEICRGCVGDRHIQSDTGNKTNLSRQAVWWHCWHTASEQQHDFLVSEWEFRQILDHIRTCVCLSGHVTFVALVCSMEQELFWEHSSDGVKR